MTVTEENDVGVSNRSRCLNCRSPPEVAMDHRDVAARESQTEGGRESISYLRLVIIAMNRDEWGRSFQQFHDVEAGEVAKMNDHVRSRQRGQ
ncbi:MAG: hypothetical protein M3Z66_01165 [Chloroflexota bacterium]|nr:hypothetical protein [Chloroflexota bacterium]